MLEAGRSIDPETDYVMPKQPYELRYRGRRGRAKQGRERPIQRQWYACDAWSEQFFVRDDLNPYMTDDDKPFSWIRSRQVGGRSIVWGRQVYRWSDLDCEANARDGFGVDWPIRYADLEPWYDHVERFIGVSGQAERGCTTHSYFSSLAATLPAAASTGRMTLRPHSVVHSVVCDPVTGRVDGVRVIDAESHDAIEFRGRLVFLCASALESTGILLNSTDERVAGRACELAGPAGAESHGSYDGRGRRRCASGHGWQVDLRSPAQRDLSAALWQRFRSASRIYGFGECLPRGSNRVTLDAEAVDAWGIPALRIQCEWSDNERAALRDMSTPTGRA